MGRKYIPGILVSIAIVAVFGAAMVASGKEAAAPKVGVNDVSDRSDIKIIDLKDGSRCAVLRDYRAAVAIHCDWVRR